MDSTSKQGMFLVAALAVGIWIGDSFRKPTEMVPGDRAPEYVLQTPNGYPCLLKPATGEVFILNPQTHEWIALPVPLSVPRFQIMPSLNSSTAVVPSSSPGISSPTPTPVGTRVRQNGRNYRFDGTNWVAE